MRDDTELRDRILAVIRSQPTTAHHGANVLAFCLYRVWRALKDMETCGLVYHRSYPVRWPSGAEHVVNIYFPAGMADGMSCNRQPGQEDLIDMQAARTIEQGKFVQKRNITMLKELGRSLHP